MRRVRELGLALLLAVTPLSLPADDAMEARLRERLRAVTEQLRTAEDARNRLQAEKTAIEQERDALRARAATAEGELERAQGGLQRQSAQRAAAEGELGTLRPQLQSLQQQAQACTAERDRQAAALAAAATAQAQCREHNQALYTTARELLGAYESVGFTDVLSAREPFLARKRVEMENLAQDFGDRVEDHRLPPLPQASAPAADPQ